MTKKKINLEELKVTSFVTENEVDADKVKGGWSFNCGIPTINVVT